MTTLIQAAQAAITGPLSPRSATGHARAVLVIRAATTPQERAEAFRFVMSRRAESRAWMTETQRKWQGYARTQARARHHDSVAIREKWVRMTY